jgi:hypothetical protein
MSNACKQIYTYLMLKINSYFSIMNRINFILFIGKYRASTLDDRQTQKSSYTLYHKNTYVYPL